MRFKKGDTVYYIAADDSVKRAIISHTHPKDKEFPYELDLPVKNRFYPDDCVFATMEEANRAVKKAQQDRMSAAIRDGKELNLKQKMPDVSKLSRFFMLPEKERLELDKLCRAVDDYCTDHNVPYMLTVVMGRKKAKGGSMELVRTTSCFPGERCPYWMLDFWEEQEDILGFGPDDE